MITIQRKVRLGRRRRVQKAGAGAGAPGGRIPRVARLMALALRFDQLIRDGVVADQADLARLGHVTRARVAQIMNLLQLAPVLQEQIVFLPNLKSRCSLLTERQLRTITAILDWQKQRKQWTKSGRAAWIGTANHDVDCGQDSV
jgi:hypothetical protein